MTEDNFERMYFEYVVNRNVPALAVDDPVILTILGDADFEWWWVKASREIAASVSLTMKEIGTGRDFIGLSSLWPAGNTMRPGILIDNFAGTAQTNSAFPLAVPYVMPATRSYLFRFANISVGTNQVQIVLSGFKRFPKSNAAQAA